MTVRERAFLFLVAPASFWSNVVAALFGFTYQDDLYRKPADVEDCPMCNGRGFRAELRE